MKKTKGNTSKDKTANGLLDHQSAIDTALNEKIRSEGTADSTGTRSNRPEKGNRKTDVSEKKTGGGKQSSPGD